MLSMLSTILYFMVVVVSTVAMPRNSSFPSKMPNLNETRSIKETFIQDWLLNNINQSVDPCEDFYQYACGGALYNSQRSLQLVTESRRVNHISSILKSHPALIKFQNACQEDFKSPPRLPTLIKDTITKIENSNDVSSIMAIVGTLLQKTNLRIILKNGLFSPILLRNGKFIFQLSFNLGFDLKLGETNRHFKTHLDDFIVKNKILSHEELEQIPSIIKTELLLKKSATFNKTNFKTEGTSQRTIAYLLNRYPNNIRSLLQNYVSEKLLNAVFVHPDVNEDSFDNMEKFLNKTSLSTVKGVFKYIIVYEVLAMQPQCDDSIKNIEEFCKKETSRQFRDLIDEEYRKQNIDPRAYSVAKTIGDSIVEEAKLTLNKKDSLLDESTRKAFREKINSIKTLVGLPDKPETQKKKQLKATTYIDMDLELQGIDFSSYWNLTKMQQNFMNSIVGDSANNGRYRDDLHAAIIYSGRLQFPVFDVSYPLVVQYGILGSTFGHEFTHSIHPGNIKRIPNTPFHDEKWYLNKQSKVDYDHRVDCYIDFYSKLQITNDKGELVTNVNGYVTLKENVAESGTQLAYSAFMKTGDTEDILGVSAEKLFYLSYAASFCTLLPSNEDIDNAKNEPHPLFRERVNGNLMLDPNFAKAFQCSATSTMNPKQKCNWWG